MRFKHHKALTVARFILLSTILLFAVPGVAQHPLRKFEIGAELTQWYLPVHPNGTIRYTPGAGLIFGYKFSRYVAVDSALNFMPAPDAASSFAGGNVTQGQFGIRAGIQKGRVGFFGKLRPGFTRFGNVIVSVTGTFPNATFNLGPLVYPSLDSGGILSVDVTNRFAVRYEIGETVVFYGNRNPSSTPSTRSFTSNNFQFSTGAFWRF